MILDARGQEIKENIYSKKPVSGQQIIADPMSDRDSMDVARGVTPAVIDRIMIMANGGDPEEQCKLARELPEKNFEITHALGTRRNAISGCPWTIVPGEENNKLADQVCEAAKKAVNAAGGDFGSELGRLDSFCKMLCGLSDAILPGYAASETIWKPGGVGFYGFRVIPQHFLSFDHAYRPKLRTTCNYSGVEIPVGKMIFHTLNNGGSDPVRGGLIRPLAWLFCFSQVGTKDLLSFIERYGMPFVVGKVDNRTYKEEGANLQSLIRSFGPNGGGIFSKNVEIELLQAANNTGDVYFTLLRYVGDAITKVLLGQTASSGDSSGMSNGNAQSAVRQDILEADARGIEESVRMDLFTPFVRYNFGLNVPVPKLQIETAPAEDKVALATTVKTLYEAGFSADAKEMSAKFGIKLSAHAPEQSQNAPAALQMAEHKEEAGFQPLRGWLGPVAESISKIIECDDDKFAAQLSEVAGNPHFGSSKKFEDVLEGSIYDNYCTGATSVLDKLEGKKSK